VVLAHPDPDPVPSDLAFLLAPGETISARLPEDIGERTLITLDCASELRMWHEPVHEAARRVVNIDHHQDNTGFGDLNLIEPRASSTAEVVVHVLEAAGWPIGADVAVPLYVGLVTDTGRFGYSNTRSEAHRVAALLVAAGADPSAISQRLYEEQPLDRVLLMGRALGRARLALEGRMMSSALTEDDFAAAGGDDTEGIVEVMRGTRGVRVAALTRRAGPEGKWRVSLRAADEGIDVSELARMEGGGGHRQAAGFSTERAPDDLMRWLEGLVRTRLDG
jgi:bifunctional oligoribonuclease and PAP phosphatase NrnA